METHLRGVRARATHTEDEKHRSLEPATEADKNWVPLVLYDDEGVVAVTRDIDEYIDVTMITKSWDKYIADPTVQAYVHELSTTMHIAEDNLVMKNNTSTWVHPILALHMAGWDSPRQQIRLSRLLTIGRPAQTSAHALTASNKTALSNAQAARDEAQAARDEAQAARDEAQQAARDEAQQAARDKATLCEAHGEAMKRGQLQLDVLWEEKEMMKVLNDSLIEQLK
jgi:hypothetical protein